MNKSSFSILISYILFQMILFGNVAFAQSETEKPDPLLAEVSLKPYELQPGQQGEITIQLTLPKGYLAYEDKFRLQVIEPVGFKITPVQVGPVIEFHDKFSKKTRKGVLERSTLKAQIEAPLKLPLGQEKLKLKLAYQACTDTFCLFPLNKILETPIQLFDPSILNSKNPNTQSNKSDSLFTLANFTEALEIKGPIIFVLAFIAGILTSFTPCIFPMIPITLAVLGNGSERRSRKENFLLSVLYVLGIATTYSLLGLIAASSGALFGASLGNPYILTLVSLVFLAMSLSMYGLYELQVPKWIQNKFGGSVNSFNPLLTGYLSGLFAGIVASPCVGPVLVSILAYVATHQDMVLGFFLLMTYALGLGLIFLVLGLSNQLTRLLPRSGPWMNSVKFILGTFMLGTFYYYLHLLLAQRWYDTFLGVGLIVLGILSGAFSKPTSWAAPQVLRKAIMLSTFLVGIGFLAIGVFNLQPQIEQKLISTNEISQVPKANWQPYSEELLNKANRENKPVIIDVWAEWCAACIELEKVTFQDPRVQPILNKFVLLKFDATKESEVLKKLKNRYNIQGLPFVILYDNQGVWLKSLTLTEYEDASKFLTRLNSVLLQNPSDETSPQLETINQRNRK